MFKYKQLGQVVQKKDAKKPQQTITMYKILISYLWFFHKVYYKSLYKSKSISSQNDIYNITIAK